MDSQVTDNLVQNEFERKRRRNFDITRQSQPPSPSPSPSSSSNYPTFSSLLAATSLLFVATASQAQAAPQSRPTSTPPSRLSNRQLEKSRAIEPDSASTSINYPFPLSTISKPPSQSTKTSSPLYPTTTLAPEKRKRQVLPKYEYSDGSWIIDTGWTLRGSIPTISPLHTRHRATALADSIETISSQPFPSSSPSSLSRSLSSTTTPTTTISSSPTSSVHTPAFNQHAYASASDVPIPRGWQTRPRETDFYAVPVIIAMSVLVAIVVVIAILGSVCWRKKKRRRRDPEKDLIQEKGWRGIVQRATTRKGGKPINEKKEKRRKKKVNKPEQEVVEEARETVDSQSLRESIGSAGSGSRTPRIVRTTGFSAVSERSAPRWRRRRRNRRNGEDEGGDASDDEERTALTRTDTRSTTSSAGPRDALTARLSARLHGSSSSSSNRGPSTVFSQVPARTRSSSDLSRSNDPFPRTSTQDSRLTRSTSHSSLSAPGPTIQPPSILFTPADDPTLSPRPPGTPTFESLSRVPSRNASSSSPALSQTSDPLAQTSAPTSSFNALLSHDADMSLPLMPGPPAYRPASSTVQSTRRYGAGDSPSVVQLRAAPRSTNSRITNIGRRRRGRNVEEAEEEEQGEEWHWPGEKGRHLVGESEGGGAAAVAGSSSSSSSPFTLSNNDEETQDEEEAEELPVDRSLYQAHLATDDKAVLNRLRTATYRSSEDGMEEGEIVEGSRTELPAPSAPPVVEEDEEFDEDGFEKFDPHQVGNDEESQVGFTTSEKAKLRAPPSPRQNSVSTLLPAPPSRTDFNYSYLTRSTPPVSSSATPSTSKSALAAEYAALDPTENEELDLPVYLPQERRSEVLGMASAPPVGEGDDDDEDEVEGDVGGEGVTFATI